MSKLCFYVDDSGPRDPDRKPDRANMPDWFGVGGILVREADADNCNNAIRAFRSRWPEMGDTPLRSYDIRNMTKGFRWLAAMSIERRTQFMDELGEMLCTLPVLVHGCVVDRPGYNARYRIKYGPRRWMLCKTAFKIAIERAAKVAISKGERLRVYVERSDAPTEKRFEQYFDSLREAGLPFDPALSAKYAPLMQVQLKRTLYEFRIKTKESLLMQVADLVLWPICQQPYNSEHRALAMLRDRGKLLDAMCTTENGLLGIKYSCFDQIVPPKKQEPAKAGS